MMMCKDAAAAEEHEGRTFYFRSHGCHQAFVNEPHRYGHPKAEPAGGHSGHGGLAGPLSCARHGSVVLTGPR